MIRRLFVGIPTIIVLMGGGGMALSTGVAHGAPRAAEICIHNIQVTPKEVQGALAFENLVQFREIGPNARISNGLFIFTRTRVMLIFLSTQQGTIPAPDFEKWHPLYGNLRAAAIARQKVRVTIDDAMQSITFFRFEFSSAPSC